MTLEDFLKREYNYNPEIKDDIKTYIAQWESWYKGNVRSFHNYYIYNGQRKVNKHRYTMNMAKEISEDWSDLLWSEKCKISFENEESQNQFDGLVDETDMNVLINQAIEKSGALGTHALVVSVYDIKQDESGVVLDVTDAKTRIEAVDIDWIFPLSWNSKTITECAFGSVEYIDGIKHVILSVHKINESNGNYIIYNHLFRDTNGNLTEIDQSEDTFEYFDTKSDVKWFSIFKPLLTNNLFNNNPFGIPHYANAIDNLKAVDISFDALKNEIKDGRRRTFVRADMLNYDTGEQKMVFDPNDTDIYVLPKGADKDDLIQNDSDTLRTGQQIETLNANLNILGNKVGFGENHYHFDGQVLSTATAVISSNSKMFRRKKKLEIGYESSIFDLVQAVCYASSTFGSRNINAENMVIQFDDSIIEDKQTESARAMQEVAMGIASKQEYREKIFGETPEIAEENIKKVMESLPTTEQLVNQENDQEDEQEDEEENKNKVEKK